MTDRIIMMFACSIAVIVPVIAGLSVCSCYHSYHRSADSGTEDWTGFSDFGEGLTDAALEDVIPDPAADDAPEDADVEYIKCACRSPECSACECFARHCSDPITCEVIETLESALWECFPHNDPYTLEFEAYCFINPIGTDSRNGKVVVLAYSCSDLCPTYGGVYIVYRDAPESECESLGGTPAYDVGWGGYVGCQPPGCP